mgnify:CR=1 FL=1
MFQDQAIPTRNEIRVHILHHRDGQLLGEYRGGDVIANLGLDLLDYRLGTADAGRVRYLRASAIGTGTGAPAGASTKLGSVVYQGTAPFAKGAATGSFTLNRVFKIGSTYAMRESGLFVGTKKDALLRGTMYSRGTYPVRNVVSGDQITVNYTVGFTSA